MDTILTLASLASFFALVLAWVGMPHTAEVATEMHAAPTAA
jgi:hypothetical protein